MLRPRWLETIAPPRIDALIAVAFVIIAESEVWVGWSDGAVGEPLRGARWAEAVLMGLGTASLAWRRRAPLAAVAATGGALSLQVLLVTPTAPFLAGLLPLLILTFSVAAHAQRSHSVIGLLVVVATIGVLTARIAALRTGGEITFSIVTIAGTWSMGRFIAARQRLTTRLAARTVALEREREQAQAALAEERSRIARELHDVISHSVSLMGVQAGAVRMLLQSDPDRARKSLRSIEATARDSVEELRRLLGVLRTPDSVAPTSPQPGLADVPQLVEQVRRAGMPVDLAIEERPLALSRGVELAAYRIIQEALTNALKHSGAGLARVSVRCRADELELEVTDDGSGPNGNATAGHGLIGMRERATLYGGKLDAGPGPSGGYAVHVRLPLAREP